MAGHDGVVKCSLLDRIYQTKTKQLLGLYVNINTRCRRKTQRQSAAINHEIYLNRTTSSIKLLSKTNQLPLPLLPLSLLLP